MDSLFFVCFVFSCVFLSVLPRLESDLFVVVTSSQPMLATSKQTANTEELVTYQSDALPEPLLQGSLRE